MTAKNQFAELFALLKGHYSKYLPHGIILEEFFEVESQITDTRIHRPEITIKVYPYGKEDCFRTSEQEQKP